jgi:putative flavoprotein involved in K+ transport
MSSTDEFNTIVIGAGQAGLAAGYYLKQKGDHFAILDENSRIGASWRNRWDSLRMNTPSFYNRLPRMNFPKPDLYFPTKDEAADFLEQYARQFNLPIRLGMKVYELDRDGAGFRLMAGESSLQSRNVIIATGAFQKPFIPAMSEQFKSEIQQVHSANYRNPDRINARDVLVVGAGNSGGEIAIELARAGKRVWMAGRDVGRPPAINLRWFLGGKPYWWFLRNVVTLHTPIGRRLKAKVLGHGNPLVSFRREDVIAAGVEATPRVVGAKDGCPQLEDGRVIPAEAIIWASGYRSDYDWVKLPVFDAIGRPEHRRGVVPEVPGLFFLGLPFQTGLTSPLFGGVGRDDKYIAGQIH